MAGFCLTLKATLWFGSKTTMQTYKTYYKSPLGPVEVVGNQDSILVLDFVEEMLPADDELTFCVKECLKQLDEYFNGQRQEFFLNLEPAGTEFQKSVWRQLEKIPYGETTSYGKVANDLGKPSASRAVGSANGKNPIAIVIPCHRVIGSDGSLTGYGGGLWRKRWLIGFERGEVKQPPNDIIA
jgi:methylated-DNA-[protein]-cysteine S-methyltransferase